MAVYDIKYRYMIKPTRIRLRRDLIIRAGSSKWTESKGTAKKGSVYWALGYAEGYYYITDLNGWIAEGGCKEVEWEEDNND